MFALLCFDRTESTGESVLARDRRQEGHRDGQNENDTPHYKKDKILIERIQKRFTRMILSIKDRTVVSGRPTYQSRSHRSF